MSDQNEKQAVTIDEIKEDKRLTERAICRMISEFAGRNSVAVEAVNLRKCELKYTNGITRETSYFCKLDVRI